MVFSRAPWEGHWELESGPTPQATDRLWGKSSQVPGSCFHIGPSLGLWNLILLEQNTTWGVSPGIGSGPSLGYRKPSAGLLFFSLL